VGGLGERAGGRVRGGREGGNGGTEDRRAVQRVLPQPSSSTVASVGGAGFQPPTRNPYCPPHRPGLNGNGGGAGDAAVGSSWRAPGAKAQRTWRSN
jgi:hypothetical protein